ncbi:MAG: hypothetical protein A2583_13845 [Bdellovibrionales bacterium RIFOXYD1_FULL_53_11]|nr:MAG: hypothetical protein A2583_13845 [Bdellovibrionales bacterium RIFOXYD1_FULL_53_11]
MKKSARCSCTSKLLIITAAIGAVAGAMVMLARQMTSTEIALYRKPTYQIPESWTPVKSLSTADNALANLAYEGLFSIDRTLGIQPQLVESWKLDTSGTNYTFNIKKGVRFHDGTVLASRHVTEMFRNLVDKDSPVRLRYARIKQVVAFDEFTVKVELKSPYPPFISLLAAPAAKLAIQSEQSPYPYGTGAFRIVGLNENVDNKTLLLERFDGFHGEKPAIRRMELVEADQKSAIEGVLAGTFHDSVIYPYFKITDERLKASKAVRQNVASTTTWVLALNSGSGPTSDVRLRRCLSQSFDRKKFIAGFIPEQSPALGIIPPTLSGSSMVKPADMPRENCHGFSGIRLKLVYPEVLERGAEMCAAFSSDFEKIGVQIRCEGLPFDKLLRRITKKDFNIAFLAQTLDLPDVEYFLEAFESTAPYNLSNYRSKTLDHALAMARQEPDRARRAGYFAEIDRELYRNAVTINISYPPHISYWNRCLENNALSMAGESYADYEVIKARRGCRIQADGRTQ